MVRVSCAGLPMSPRMAKPLLWSEDSPRSLRTRWGVLLILVYLLLAGGPQWNAGAAETESSATRQSAPTLDVYQRDRILRTARQRQEQFRKRVPIKDAVGDNVPLASALRARQHSQPEQAHASFFSGIGRQNLVLIVAFLLTGILVMRKLSPWLFEGIPVWYNPWALTMAITANLTEKIRSEETAFSEFLAAFKVGPTGKPVLAQALAAATANGVLVKEFLVKAPSLLARLKELLQEISHADKKSVQQQKLKELLDELRGLKGAAGFSELLPVWQMACALEGLLRQLTEKASNVTPSTLRTLAGGVDLFESLCTWDLKPDLLTDPPIRLLAVDDDPICGKAVSVALKKALNAPDLAPNGEKALALAAQQAYDVIFLDVEMPGMDGFELCTRLHQTALNSNTPVVFVTCHSDFNARAQSALSGGWDLIAKPFLTFEITVKALTLTMRDRLHGRTQPMVPRQTRVEPEAGAASEPIPGLNTSPASPLVGTSPANGAAATKPQRGRGRRRRRRAGSRNQPTVLSAGADSTLVSDASPPRLADAFVTRALAQLDPMREILRSLLQTADAEERQDMLADVYLRLHSIAPPDGVAVSHPAVQLTSALGGLLRKLLAEPRNSTVSALATVSAGVDLLNELCVPGLKPDLATQPPIRILVADDDPVACRALTCAVQMSFEKPENAENGEAAVAAAGERPFDLIFLDVIMPGMDGFEACSKIRETTSNSSTPVVFVTGLSDFKARTQMSLSGGSDFMVKPFLNSEITVKALTFALRGRLAKLDKPPVKPPRRASAENLTAVLAA